MNYLVAYDYSQDSELALSTVFNTLSSSRHDKIFLVNVIGHLNKSISLFGQSEKNNTAQKVLEKEHQVNLSNLLTKLQSEGHQNVTGIVLVSDHVGEALCKLATDKQIDIIVMGRRGMSGIKRVVLGSNSKYCSENAPCNVMIVKQELTDTTTALPQKPAQKSAWQEHSHFAKIPNVEICQM